MPFQNARLQQKRTSPNCASQRIFSLTPSYWPPRLVPKRNRLKFQLKVHLYVNFGFQQDNQSLTRKQDENKFVFGSAPSKRRTKKTKKPINYNTECTTKSFIVFLASKTQHMILQPALSLLPPGEANNFTLRESGYGTCGVPDPSDNSIVLIGGGGTLSPHRSVDKSLRC